MKQCAGGCCAKKKARPSRSVRPQTIEKSMQAYFFLQVAHCILANMEDFAPAGATKGLSDRPLETFGPIRYRVLTRWEA